MEYSNEDSNKIIQEGNQHISNQEGMDLELDTYPQLLLDSSIKNTTDATITNVLPSYDSFEFDPLSLDIFEESNAATKIKNKYEVDLNDDKSIFSDSSGSNSDDDVNDNDSDVVMNLIGASQKLLNSDSDTYSVSTDDDNEEKNLNRKEKLSSKKKKKHKNQDDDEYNDKIEKKSKSKPKRSTKHKSMNMLSENNNATNNDVSDGKDNHKPVISVVESEIAMIKSLENGPSEAELRRRNLIEIDEDELEERIEKLNKNTIELISKQLGLSKHEQLQKIIACRTFLKKYINKDDDLDAFIEETIDKHNDRIYGRNAEVAIDALDYLDKVEYPSDNDDLNELDTTHQEEVEVNINTTNVHIEERKQDIILSDSEEEEEEEEDDHDVDKVEVIDVKDVEAKPIIPNVPHHSKDIITSTTLLLLSKEEIELEQRKEKFLQANKLLAKNPRSKLRANLRSKVHQIAIDNYCHAKRINTDELSLKLEISEKCRQLVELLKDRFEARMLREEAERELSRSLHRLKYEQQNGDEEEEFDASTNTVGELGEGLYVTAAEKAQLINTYHNNTTNTTDDDEEENDDDREEGSDDDDDIRPVDEEIQGLRQLLSNRERENHDMNDVEDDVSDEDVNDKNILSSNEDSVEDNDDERVIVRKSKFTQDNNTNLSEPNNEKPIRYGRLSRLNNSNKNNSDDDLDEDQEEVNKNEDTIETNDITSVNIDNASNAINDNEEDAANGNDKQKEDKNVKMKKHKSTGNILYKLALEEEERRSRKKKTNALFDEEAEEEEEEGIQAGLGDFGFGVTTKVREYDEEVSALKYRQGDLDHIVDDVSDGEGDENAGLLARAEMELREDKERTRQIITAVTEGHDVLKKMNQKGKYTFDRLVAGDVKKSRRDNNTDGNEVVEDEEDEEEIIQRGFANRFERERLAKAKRGMNSDSDSDSAVDSDEDQINDLFDTTDMTEEQKTAEIERIQRIREKNRMDHLMAKQNIQSYKMAREKKRQEKLSRQKSQLIMMQQQQSTHSSSQYQLYYDTNTSTTIVPTLSRLESSYSRSLSTSHHQTHHSNHAVGKSMLTLEPLHDEYSRLYQNSMMETAVAVQPSSTSNMFGESSSGPLVDITNANNVNISNTMKRRTSLPPKHMNESQRRPTLKRSHTMLVEGKGGSGGLVNTNNHNIYSSSSSSLAISSSSSTTAAASVIGKEGGMYRSELNKLDVENGYGMGMAIAPLSTRGIKSTEHAANGLFSAVVGTGMRSLGRTNSTTLLSGGSGNNTTSNMLRPKRSFSEHHHSGKLSSTVASQQFIFTGGDDGSRSALGNIDNSNTGFSRSISINNNMKTASNHIIPSTSTQSLSLFAQLGTKRIKSGTSN